MTRNPFKWPGTADKTSDRSAWLKGLSDDELDDLMVQAGLTEQDDLDRQRDSRLMIALANLPGGPPEYLGTLRGLMSLRDVGPFPLEALDMYDRLRARALADVKAAHRAAPKVTPSPADVTADMSVAGWLKARWSSADEAVRHTLRSVAESLSVPIPMSRTRTQPPGVKDSGFNRRSDSDQHPNRDDSEPLESPPETEPEDRYDGPQWSDDDALDWEPCESLHEAFRSDADWY